MEQVWQDISLYPLQDNSSPPPPPTVTQRHQIGNLHDFLTGGDRSPPEPLIPQRGISFPPLTSHLGSATVFRGVSSPSTVGFVPPKGMGSRPTDGDKKSLSGEQWHKRRIKNRESADRSRARKQAYTQSLELKVDRLKKENAKLRRLLHLVRDQLL
ncbi:Protein FD [Linum grandiflorum]